MLFRFVPIAVSTIAVILLGTIDRGGAPAGLAAAAPSTTVAAVPFDDSEVSSDPTLPSEEPAQPPSSPGDDGGDETGDAPAPEATEDETSSSFARPTVRSTDIDTGSLVLALGVLAAAIVAWRVAARRRDTGVPPGTPVVASGVEHVDRPRPPATIDPTTSRFLVELGEALVDAGDAVHSVTSTLEGVARVNGEQELVAVVLPTALILSAPSAGVERTEIAIAGRSSLRLDQIEAVMELVRRAELGEVTPEQGCRRLREIRDRPHPSTPPARLLGSALAAAGLALVLRGGPAEVLLAAALGGVVGAINLATASARSIYRPFWPLLASFVVAAATFTALRLADVLAFPALIAPLITFLPGALLTIAVLELATGQIIAGSSRLASGVFQLVLLALGIVAGAELVGVPVSAVGSAPEGPIAVAGPWVGVAVFGAGIAWSQGLRAASTPWVLVVLYVAYAGQVVGGAFVGSALSSFFGAVAMTPVAVFLSRRGLGPTTLVMFFPGFWMLVPGALGLEGVTRILGDGGLATTGALTTSLTSMVGIALGVLVGLALSAPDPERPWTSPLRVRVPASQR